MKRRRFLSRMGGGAAGALAAASLGSLSWAGRLARADDAPPLRLVTFFTPNGPMGRDYWSPPGSGDRVIEALPAPMEPLLPHASNLLMLGGLSMPHPSQNHSAIGRLLTGRPNAHQPEDPGNQWGEGVSIDQYIASMLGQEALVLGVRTGDSAPLHRLSYRGPFAPVDPYDDPADAFRRLFADHVDADAEAARARWQRRASLLDASVDETARLASGLGTRARERLDRHQSLLRELEERALASRSGIAACVPSPLGDTAFDHTLGEHAVRTTDLQVDVLTQALACDVRQVATLQVGTSGDTFGYRVADPARGIDFGYMDEHNEVVHTFDPANTTPDGLAAIERRMQLERIYYGMFARLLDRLASVPEGDGTLLDSTVVLWCKSLAAQNHRADPMLFMLAGGTRAGLRPGRFLDRTGESPNDLYVALARLFGLEIDEFGDPTWCSGRPMDLA